MSNPVTGTKTTTLLDSKPNQVAQTKYSYDQYNNITDQKDYDWGGGTPGGLLRETQSIYLWANNVNLYAAGGLNLVHAPYQQKILDINGNQTAFTLWQYDQVGVQDASGIIGHDSADYGRANQYRGNVTSLSRYWNSTNADVSEMTYDIGGNVVSVEDGNTHLTQLYYNDDGTNQYTLPTSVKNALNQVSRAAYDYNIDRILNAVDLNGQSTTYSYNDPLDRLVEVRLANGGTIGYGYTGAAQVNTYQDQTLPGDGLLQSQINYDGLGRVTQSSQRESASTQIVVRQTYDALGRVASSQNPSRPGDGLNYTTTYAYDSLGRTTSVQTPDGATAATSYSGNQTTVTDQAKHARQLTTNALGWLMQVVEDPGGLTTRRSMGTTRWAI